MIKQDIQVVTHTDLDGVVSYLVLCWLYGKKLDVIGTTPMKLEQDVDKLFSSKKRWDRLYFLDLDVSKIGEKIDHQTTVVLDHHKTNLYQFKNAVVRVYNETSCAKLIYDTFFKAANKQITAKQKTLIALADDWDSNRKVTPLSEQLNIVYHSMSDKFNSFVEDYFQGFVPFDKFKQNSITLYKRHLQEYLKTIQPYIGEVEFQEQKNVKVGAVFCDKYIQECCDLLFTKYHVDIAIAVILNQHRIAVRRSPNNTNLDVSSFAQRIAHGGGHEAAAGGNLTDEFAEFTKMLKPI